jgi:hypothetical protein
MEWTTAIETLDAPSVAIPLRPSEGVTSLRLIRVFTEVAGRSRLVSIDLRTHDEGRGRPRSASIGEVVTFDGDGETFLEQVREHLERCYLSADHQFRDRCLRDDDGPEPLLLLISESSEVTEEVRAAAATFGAGVETMRENIARDTPELLNGLDRVKDRLAAVALWEPSREGRLAWVADQIRARVLPQVPVERLAEPSGPPLREETRLVLAEALGDGFAVPPVLKLPTCAKCQPAVSRIIDGESLSIGTRETDASNECVCEGYGAQGQSIRMRFALRLTEAEGVLIIGYQPNFDAALADIAGIAHIGNAGDPKAAAARVQLAIVVPGSAMGHAESGRYLTQLNARGVRVAHTSGNQLSDVVRLLIDEAVGRLPTLRH